MAANVKLTKAEQEVESVKTGRLDAFLTALFATVSTLFVQLIEWILSDGLDLIDGTTNESWWPLAKGAVILVLTAMLKGIDRKKHEDPSSSTGLIKL